MSGPSTPSPPPSDLLQWKYPPGSNKFVVLFISLYPSDARVLSNHSYLGIHEITICCEMHKLLNVGPEILCTGLQHNSYV